eukprot:15338850-Ditylum_brightwellii.AAC.1
MKTNNKMEKTENDPLNILLVHNLKLEERIKDLEELVIALTRRVKTLEEMKKKAKNDSMFVVGEDVKYPSKPAYKPFGEKEGMEIRRHKKNIK